MSDNLVEIFIEKLKAVLTMSLANEFNISSEGKIENFDIENFDHDEYVFYKNEFSNLDETDLSVVISKEYTAKLADLMVMGDGTAEFSADEHLDAIKELFDQVSGAFSTEVLSKTKVELQSEKTITETVKKDDLPTENKSLYLLKFEDDNQNAVIVFSSNFLSLFEEKSTDSSGSSDSESSPGLDKLISNPNIKNLLDTDIEIEIFYGNTKRKIEDILLFNNDTVLELNDLKDEAVDIYVNGKIFAKGKIVVINKSYSVEIKKIISIKERILSLKS